MLQVSVPFLTGTTLHDTPGVVLDDAKQALYEKLALQGGVATIRRVMPLKRRKARRELAAQDSARFCWG